MKKKDIKSLIKQEIESHIPKKPVTIDWAYVERERELEQIEYKQKPAVLRQFRLSLSFVLTLLFGIGVWWMVSNFNQTPPGVVPDGITIFEQEQEVLPVSFLSTAALLPTQTNLDVANVMLIADTTTLTDPLKPFLGMIEMIISQSQGPMVQVKPSDLAEYETLVEIKTFDLLGQPITYEMYYNVISYEEDGDESTFEIEGLMKNDHMTYPMTGKKEIEDGEEKLIVKGILSETEYIQTTYESEDDEMKYIIRRVENGILVYESKLRFEQSGDEIQVKLEIESATEISQYELKYELDEDKPIIKIEFEMINLQTQDVQSGEMKLYVVLDELTSMTSYEFSLLIGDEEFFEEYERDVKHDDDDDEDDEDDEEDEEDEENEEETEDSESE